MASLPDYITVLFAGRSDSIDPGVSRTQMDRGPAKQMIKNSQVLRTIEATLQFKTQQDMLDFEHWYFTEIKRIGWFDFFDSRSRTTRSVRFVGGDIGTLTPLMTRFAISQRTVKLEYYQ